MKFIPLSTNFQYLNIRTASLSLLALMIINISLPTPISALSNEIPDLISNTDREEITNFHSDIVLFEDSSLEITEKITVKALGNQIKRGIYRDYPTIYNIPPGFRNKTGFEIISVTKDGSPEPYHTVQLSNGVRVYFGDEDVYLQPDLYTYEFKYRTDRQIEYEELFDRLFYNVTGDDWGFPIANSSATLILPGSISSSQINNIGYFGEKGSENTSGIEISISELENSTRIEFINSNSLPPGNGFTIRTEFPKGVVQQPTISENINFFVSDNLGELGYFFAVLALLFLAVFVWYIKGRDPTSDAIYPQFNIPEGLSPAIARYINNMSYDPSIISIILVSLAVKGYVMIQQKKKKLIGEKFIVTKLKEISNDFTSEEALFMKAFFASTQSITFSGTYSSMMFNSAEKIKKFFNEELKNVYFSSNLAQYLLLLFFALSISGGYLFFSYMNGNFENLYPIFMLTFWSCVVGFLLAILISAFIRFNRMKNIVGMIFIGSCILFLLPFLFIEIFFLFILDTTGILVLPSTLMLLTILSISPNALKMRTITGRELQDKIEGLKMFILATEEDKIRLMHNDLPRNMDTFNKYFPYAMALGIEAKWVNKFEDVIRETVTQDQNGRYNYGWYATHSSFTTSSFTNSLSGTLSGTVSSSSTPPNSSGGVGGSGGGGGGGGGGGW